MGLEIRPVKGALGRARFVGIPFRLFASDPQWTPPLRQSVRDRLSPRHPAAEHQRTRLWMAFQDSRPVGRIAACVDTMFNDYHGLAWAWVGFFECVDNPAVSAALFDAAWSWAAKEGMQVCVGPGSFTTNDEIGLLVEGREYPPALLTPHNPAYYEKLWVDAGWKPVMDLWGWRFGPHIPRLSERQQAALERLARRGPYRVRSASMRNFDAEVHRFFDIYNAAWSRNWGFAPMTHAEVSHLAKELRLIADPDLALFVELDSGETIAAALAVPDINQATARLRDGRLLPIGWLRLLLAQRRLTQARILLLGVRPEYETRGVGPLLYSTLIQRLAAKPRMASAEASWTLATNKKINSAIEAIGATHHKTWRLYEHRVGLSAGGRRCPLHSTTISHRCPSSTSRARGTASGGPHHRKTIRRSTRKLNSEAADMPATLARLAAAATGRTASSGLAVSPTSPSLMAMLHPACTANSRRWRAALRPLRAAPARNAQRLFHRKLFTMAPTTPTVLYTSSSTRERAG
ncbi:MAG TPA: hypothetical protein VKV80_09385 [Streptosporangiaceae bacterium]|nr:hypothetical protein [Streptosporangiaceae bacterium]